MRRLLLASLLPLAACAHSHGESSKGMGAGPVAQNAAPSQPAPPASTESPESTLLEPLTPNQRRAREALSQAQQRLEAARRELRVATSERAAAVAAQSETGTESGGGSGSGSQSLDSLAQARAAEAARAAAQHRQLADTHFQYATQLVAARQAEVESAQVHLKNADAAAWIAAHPGTTPEAQEADQRRLGDARKADAEASARAERLGELALDAQRRWERASAPAPASAGTAGPGRATPPTGTGQGSTSPQPPQSAPPASPPRPASPPAPPPDAPPPASTMDAP